MLFLCKIFFMQSSMMKNRVTVIGVLIICAAAYRLMPHPHNFVPITGMALLAGSYLKSKKALAILLPLIALFVSDIILNNTLYRSFYEAEGFVLFQPYMIFTFLSLILIVCIGMLVKKFKLFQIIGASVGSSVLFFTVTNFGSWLTIPIYPKNMVGLAECYTAGLPFFPATVFGDLVFTLVLFGIAAFVLGWMDRKQLNTERA